MEKHQMPQDWVDRDGNHCTLLSVVTDENRKIVSYKFKNKSHKWEYRIAPESHIVYELK